MDDLERLLEGCRSRVGGRAAALVGRDGLLIETAGASDDAALDLALAAAEATDLLAVADRLLEGALDQGPATETWCRAPGAALALRRLGEDVFVLLVLPPDGDPVTVRAALDDVQDDVEAALA